MCPRSLLEEHESSNSSSLTNVMLPQLLRTPAGGGWALQVRPPGLAVVWWCFSWTGCGWLRMEVSSCRSNIGAVWEASRHTASSSACCCRSADKAFSLFFSATTWTDEGGRGRLNQAHASLSNPRLLSVNLHHHYLSSHTVFAE